MFGQSMPVRFLQGWSRPSSSGAAKEWDQQNCPTVSVLSGQLYLVRFLNRYCAAAPVFVKPLLFLTDLTRVKSVRACHPAAPRARRSSRKSSTGRFLIAHHPPAGAYPRPPRQTRPDFQANPPAQHPLPCGLRLRATDRATLHRRVALSVRGRQSTAVHLFAKISSPPWAQNV